MCVTFWGHVHLFGSRQIHVHLVVHSAVTQHLHGILGKWSHVQYTFLVLYRYMELQVIWSIANISIKIRRENIHE